MADLAVTLRVAYISDETGEIKNQAESVPARPGAFVTIDVPEGWTLIGAAAECAVSG